MARTKAFCEDKVLNNAVHLFWGKGYNATSMQDLVDKLGINRSSMYDTYGDKRQLYIAALKQYRDKWASKVIELLDASTDAKATIKKMFDVTIHESLHDEERKGCFMLNACIELSPDDTEVAAIVEENIQDVQKALARLIKRGQDAHDINTTHTPLALAHFISNAINGIRVAARLGGDKNAYRDIEHVTMSML